MTTLRSVSHIIAHRTGIAPSNVRPEARLREDLGLAALDVISVVVELELADLGTDEFPLELLQGVETVANLAMTFDDWNAQRDTYENIDVSELAMESTR